MATAYVTSQQNTETTSSATISCTVTVSAGDAILVAVAWYSTTVTLDSVSDGNAYTLVENPTENSPYGFGAGAYYLNASAGSKTITATFSAAHTDRRMFVHVVSGAATSNALDDSNGVGAGYGGGTDNISLNLVTTQAGDYLFGANFNFGQNGAITAGTGYVLRQQIATNKGASEDIESYASTGTKAVTFTDASFDQHVAIAMAIKAGSSQSNAPRAAHQMKLMGAM